MKYLIDGPFQSRNWRIVVISKSRVAAHRVGTGVAAMASKTPVAVAFHDGTTITASGIGGHPVDIEKLEARCPGVKAALEAGSDL